MLHEYGPVLPRCDAASTDKPTINTASFLFSGLHAGSTRLVYLQVVIDFRAFAMSVLLSFILAAWGDLMRVLPFCCTASTAVVLRYSCTGLTVGPTKACQEVLHSASFEAYILAVRYLLPQFKEHAHHLIYETRCALPGAPQLFS